MAKRTETAWERVRGALEENRLAHAYIIQGHAKREGAAFVRRLAHALFPDAVSRVDSGSHPDILHIEPQSKSRTILVRQIESVIARIQQKSFEGGWKLVVISDADRMAAAGANKLLKTLEEPPGKTLLLLVTETPTALLPTIISRCQQIALDPEPEIEPSWRAPLLALLAEGVPRSPLQANRQAACIKQLIDDEKNTVTAEVTAAEKARSEELDKDLIDARVTARVKATTREILIAVQAWYRDLFFVASGAGDEHLNYPEHAERLQAIGADLDYNKALKRLRNIEDVAMRMEFAPNAQALLESGLWV